MQSFKVYKVKSIRCSLKHKNEISRGKKSLTQSRPVVLASKEEKDKALSLKYLTMKTCSLRTPHRRKVTVKKKRWEMMLDLFTKLIISGYPTFGFHWTPERGAAASKLFQSGEFLRLF